MTLSTPDCRVELQPKRHRRGGWAAERRARYAALIRSRRPWTRSTGPRSRAGKAVSRLNAQKHGMRSAEMRAEMNAIRQYFRECRMLITLVNCRLDLRRNAGMDVGNITHKSR